MTSSASGTRPFQTTSTTISGKGGSAVLPQSSYLKLFLQEPDKGSDRPGSRLHGEHSYPALNQALLGRCRLHQPNVAPSLNASALKIRVSQFYSPGIGIRVACDLAQNHIAPPR